MSEFHQYFIAEASHPVPYEHAQDVQLGRAEGPALPMRQGRLDVYRCTSEESMLQPLPIARLAGVRIAADEYGLQTIHTGNACEALDAIDTFQATYDQPASRYTETGRSTGMFYSLGAKELDAQAAGLQTEAALIIEGAETAAPVRVDV